MKILFKNKTKYTKEIYEKYLQFHQKKYGNKYRINIIIVIFMLCFCIIKNLEYSNYHMVILFIIILGIFLFYKFLSPIKKVKKELKTEKFRDEKEFTFTFYEKGFIVSDEKFNNKIKYWKLYKVYETEEFFYLYINKNHAYLLDKTKFSKGDVSQFLKFLKKKIWYKI